MNQPSYIALALGILNLLLAASGLLLVYFDWSAARRREYLYLAFTEEKPGVNYFTAARSRRAQYTRLLFAFVILLLREVVAGVLYAAISHPSDWQWWVAWQQGNVSLDFTPAVALAAHLSVWTQTLEMLGLAALGFGFLYDSQKDRNSMAAMGAVGLVTAWALFFITVVLNLFGDHTFAVVQGFSTVCRVAVVAFVAFFAFRRRGQAPEPGFLPYDPGVLAVAFSCWLLGTIMAQVLSTPVAVPLGHMIGYLIVVTLIARGVLAEYENVEKSRHRFGRERQVMASFLKRIGSAFTTEIEVDHVLRIILESALDTTEASAGAIYLYHADTDLFTPPTNGVLHFFPPMYVDTPAALSPHRTEELEDEMKHQSFRMGEGIIGEVAQSGKPRLIEDVRAEGVMLGTTTDFMRNRSMLVVPLRLRDEPSLGVMAVLNKQRGSFDRDDQSLLQALADQGALFINNVMLTLRMGQQERIRKELEIARDIQQRLLPDRNPEVPGFVIDARATSATEVGGDYYDFFWVDEAHTRLGIVVADVSGKGVHAALVVAMIRSAFRSQARGNPDVRDVLSQVNEFMSHDLRRDMFVTCFYGVLEIPERRLSWARAGHEPLIVAHPADSIDVLSPQGFALGVVGSPDFSDALEVETLQLHSGDRVLMYTDGLTEAMNANGEEFGMERILRVMGHLDGAAPCLSNDQSASANGSASQPAPSNGSRPANPDPAAEVDDLRAMDEAVRSHVGTAPQSDDLTIVYLEAM